MRGRRGGVTLLCGILIGTAATALAADRPGERTIYPRTERFTFKDWVATELRDHPLAGKVWSASNNGIVGPLVMQSGLLGADLALLGEIHDNPDAHRVQAYAMRAMTFGKRRPAVVMEMVNEGQRAGLGQFYKEAESCCRLVLVKDLFDKLNWDKSGWPSRGIYRPVMERAVMDGLRIIPGSDAREAVRAIGKTGFKDFSAQRLRELAIDAPLPPKSVDDLAVELKDSHCGMLPDRAIPAMVNVQRYRDAYMAAAMVKNAGKHGAILIAGNGHVRTDRGVPWYLRKMAPGKKIVAVMAIEVREGETDPQAYVPRGPDGKAAVDYIVFTPRQKRQDQCAALKEHFAKKKKAKVAPQ